MKFLVILISLLVGSVGANGQYYMKRQNPDQNYQRLPSKQITINLSPIILSHGKYYFDDRHVTFEQLTMPLLAVKDEEINRKLKSLFRVKLLRAFISLIPLVIFGSVINDPQNAYYYHDFYRGAFVGSYFTIGALNQVNVSIKRKIVDRYNDVVLQPSASLQSNSGLNLGLSLKF